MKPLILVNLKLYVTGQKALRLAQQLARVSTQKYQVAIVPSLLMLREMAHQNIPVIAPHADPAPIGPFTGSVSLQEIKESGVKGVLLNHTERRIPFLVLKKTIILCRKYRLPTVICASTLREVHQIAGLHPQYIAYEPPALIGGNVSVTTAAPQHLEEAVQLVQKASPATGVLCGAGVHSVEDFRKALALGCAGVLLSHALIEAKDPKAFLEKMIS